MMTMRFRQAFSICFDLWPEPLLLRNLRHIVPNLLLHYQSTAITKHNFVPRTLVFDICWDGCFRPTAVQPLSSRWAAALALPALHYCMTFYCSFRQIINYLSIIRLSVCSVLFLLMQNRGEYDGRPVHPVGESRFPLGQRLHFCPVTPGRQTQRPVICSQSSRNLPRSLQLHAITYNHTVPTLSYYSLIWH